MGAGASQPGAFRTPSNAIVIGLTGGIASGKSTACSIVESEARAVVLNADLLGHEAYKPGTACLERLVAHFGERLLGADGAVDRKVLGGIVFADPAEMQALNGIVWPAIRELLQARVAEVASGAPREDGLPHVIVVEAAVLLEAGWQDLADEVWVVTAERELAKARLMSRNQLDASAADARIDAQMSNEARRAAAHVEVANDGDEAALRLAVTAQLAALRARYSEQSAFEVVDVVDREKDQVVSHAKRAVVRHFGLVSRCSYVVIRHTPSGKFLVQRRAQAKAVGPGLLDPAPGGVLGAGEAYDYNARREMSEELGLEDLALEHVCALFHEDGKDVSWGTVFAAEVDVAVGELKLQTEEVQAVELMSEAEIRAMPRQEFLSGGLAAFEAFLEAGSKK